MLSVYFHEAHGQANVTLEDTVIQATSASVNGGTMAFEFNRVHTSQQVFTQVLMTGNSSITGAAAEQSGGALSVLRSPFTLVMMDSSAIINAYSAESGGAIVVCQHAGPVEILLQDNSTITNCTSAEGGALSTSQTLFSQQQQQTNASSIEEQAGRLVRLKMQGSSSITSCSAQSKNGGAVLVSSAPFHLIMEDDARLASNIVAMQEGAALAIATSIGASLSLSGRSMISGNNAYGRLGSVVYLTNAANTGGPSKQPIVNIKLMVAASMEGNVGLAVVVDGVDNSEMTMHGSSRIAGNEMGGFKALKTGSCSLALHDWASFTDNMASAIFMESVASASLTMSNSSSMSRNKARSDAAVSLVGVNKMQVKSTKNSALGSMLCVSVWFPTACNPDLCS